MNPVADVRIALGAPATVAGQITDQDGEPIAPTVPVTVGVTNLAGGVVVAPGTSTTTPDNAPTVRTVTLPPPAELDIYRATWTAGTATSTTRVEIVGRFYAGPGAMRRSDPTLADENLYPTARLIQARRAVEDEFERVIGYALVPRIAVHEVRLRNSRHVRLPQMAARSVRSVTVTSGGVTITPSVELDLELDGPAGLVRFGGPVTGLVRLVYTHGLDAPDGETLDAFHTRARDVLNRENRGLSDRMTTFTSDIGGTYSLAVAGRGGSLTGIPDVDVVLVGLRNRGPV